MASPLIELCNVSMDFGQEVVLSNINLSIQKGDFFVLVGPSGGGKSTLLKIMSGILEPTAGEVLVEGRALKSLSRQERKTLVRRMGMLFQKNALFDYLTVADNIAFPLHETTSLPKEETERRISYYLEQVGIAHARNLFPDEISGGMQKRLGIDRAIALDP